MRRGRRTYSAAMPFCRCLSLVAALLFAAWPALGLADAAAPGGVEGLIEQQARQLALEGAKAAAANAPAGAVAAPRIEVEVGQLDPRLRLAPCQKVDAYVPEGTRLWGRSRIGLRCAQGAVKWNVYLPITVKVFGTAMVATNSLASGSVLAAADLAPAEVDLTEDSAAPVVRGELAIGRMLTRALKPGQSLRVSHLKLRQWFSAGETVLLVGQGEGFSVAGEAQALNPGIEGVAVRVRTESGRVLTGLPVGERRVELSL
jgi:flagellar basal body P-ring formation protein FlgA